ncbi:hypothetical protein ABMA28_000489 [Loxostege sticticalis]|uniref:HAT C-terminal dimerisation domain-containing protein n=1 Tax=Loxostege sticticalis TaxID=481309 RepID=A0ABD0TSF4_LOXSC
MSDTKSDSEEEVKRKKQKRLCVYRDQWENTFDFITKDSANAHRAFCKICRKGFSISHGGPDHQKLEKLSKKNQTLSMFLNRDILTTDDEKIIAAELVQVYHGAKHSIPYTTTDCNGKLCSVIFPDSKIANKISLGRTKASSIAFNVLAPASLEDIVNKLKDDIYFSISTDASNHGNIKLFPILVRFYTPDIGLRVALLDFYEDPNEKAVDIFTNLKTRLEGFDLKMDNISSYSADNCNVNFGIHHSVYQLLLKENPNILPAGCPAHLLHNTVKHSMQRCDFDVENLVLKVYGHLSYHSQRVQKLKEFFMDADLEYQNITRHVTTRWLSLYPAVEKLLGSLTVLQEYFLSLGDNCPVALLKYFDDDNIKKTECYLGFFHNTLRMFQDAILLLEKEEVLCCETFDIINGLRNKIKQRIDDEFLGFACSNAMKNLESEDKESTKKNLMLFYKNALKYLEDHFDFSDNNHLSVLRIFSLKSMFSFSELTEAASKLKLIDRLDMDKLYDEYCVIKDMLKSLIEEKQQSAPEKVLSAYEQWHKLFKSMKEAPGFLNIFQMMSSIPPSNSSTERVFSLCGNAWTDSRNKLSVEHVKAELQIKINFKIKCTEFYDFVLNNKNILKCAKSQNKYSFKKKP